MKKVKLLSLIVFFCSIVHLSFGQGIQKCFSNGGLKYRITIKFQIRDDNTIKGIATSDEYEDTITEQASFTGRKTGNTIRVKFDGTPPISGKASEWTNKPWVLKKVNNIETLTVVFYEMNYETEEWKNDDIEFAACEK